MELLPVHARQKLTDTLSPTELQPYSNEKQHVHDETSETHDGSKEEVQSSTMKLTVPLPTTAELRQQCTAGPIDADSCELSTAVPPLRHDRAKEGVCALAMSARSTVYAATTLGRILRMELLQDQQQGKEIETVWSSVCTVPQQQMPLSCCAARRYSLKKHRGLASTCLPQTLSAPNNGSGEKQDSSQTHCSTITDDSHNTVDVVVCGSRHPGLTLTCIPVSSNSQRAASNVVHLNLSEITQAPILALWMPGGLPPGHVLCADANNTVWWMFVHLSGTTCSTNAWDNVEDAIVVVSTCECGPKTRVSSVEVLPDSGLLVVGDSLGGVASFQVPKELLSVETASDALAFVNESGEHLNSSGQDDGHGRLDAPVRMVCTSAFRKVHASTPVTLTKATGRSLFTGGRNGVDRTLFALDCVTAGIMVSVVAALHWYHNIHRNSAQ